MHKIAIFVEDNGHEQFVRSIVGRICGEVGVDHDLKAYSNRGGYGTVIKEFRQYILDLRRGDVEWADLLVVATDANCKGYAERKREVESEVPPDIGLRVAYAIPDPHIERWYLMDSAAFKTVFGRGCTVPTLKCARNHYKKLLLEQIRETEVFPLLGGTEYAEDIVTNMDLTRMKALKDSFSDFLQDLTRELKHLKAEG